LEYTSRNIQKLNFWRTTDKKEIDFVVTTSFNEGLAYEVKMNCRKLDSTSKKKFTENYPGYRFQVVSYAITNECKWVLKL
jgi:predicted AAA+ superfamily ATPase